MVRGPLSPKVGLSVALGLLLASASAPARASFDGRDDATSAYRSFELIPSGRANELPAELRANDAAPSFAEALGLQAESGSHTVQLHWVVREGRGLSGYRITLVAADGLPGHLAARWWVAPQQGTPLAGGRTAYSAQISLVFAGRAPVSAAIEAVDDLGHAVLLGVRRTFAEADPEPPGVLAARGEASALRAIALQTNRLAPAVRSATTSSSTYPSLPGAAVGLPPANFFPALVPDGAVSPRGPPESGITS
jgi:hypothetical protein